MAQVDTVRQQRHDELEANLPEIVRRLHDHMPPEEKRKLYNEVAPQLDQLMKVNRSVPPSWVAGIIRRYMKPEDRIIDVCAGTGQIGVAMKEAGLKNLDYHDGAENMLTVVKPKEAYTNYYCQWLIPDVPLDIPSGPYDAVTAIGCFSPGNLSPEHMWHFINLAKVNGYIFVGNRLRFMEAFAEDGRYVYRSLWEELTRLEKEGVIKEIEREVINQSNVGMEGVMVVLKRLK